MGAARRARWSWSETSAVSVFTSPPSTARGRTAAAFRRSPVRPRPVVTEEQPKRSNPAGSSDCRRASLRSLLTEWSPVAKHFLDGYLQRLEGIEATVRERERLISLGRLSAGLAHEVNNPAAAALRATADLRSALTQLTDVAVDVAQSRYALARERRG